MVINYVANKKISQEKLANYLQTVKTGTYPGNIPAILNKFTNQNIHKYTRKILGLNYGLTEKEQKIFYNDVNNSLKHNFPVILSMHGKYPWNNHMIRHLIVIHGIQVSEKFEDVNCTMKCSTLLKKNKVLFIWHRTRCQINCIEHLFYWCYNEIK